MKKPKFLLKVDSNLRGKIYVNHKWLKDVTMVDIHAEPQDYYMIIRQYKRDSNGKLIVSNNAIEEKYTHIKLNRKQVKHDKHR